MSFLVDYFSAKMFKIIKKILKRIIRDFTDAQKFIKEKNMLKKFIFVFLLFRLSIWSNSALRRQMDRGNLWMDVY